jgi:hypothetical protein
MPVPTLHKHSQAFMRNSRCHTAEDKPDTLDYQRMAMTIQCVYAAVMEMARNQL